METKLPPLEKQALKFAHLRYKVFPLTDNQQEKEEFFEALHLPTNKTFSFSAEEFTEAAIVPTGGVTAAFKIDPETLEADIGLTKCSFNDVYNKGVGRLVAAGRFEAMRESKHRFQTAMVFDLTEAVEEVKDDEEVTPISSIVRDNIIAGLNDGTSKDVERDMAMVRSYVAFCTKTPFYVELS